ncbi:hypothetical protein B0H16DRAFT_1744554 [Mycena metata]|uniref:Uncharacterized protein n=1 Tax=Mycena metata TaxID=1033252 RepID=A0AAD7H4X6_9AGAR|nr:hypothetical protein B0H16DRAFT_1744554 [Mycena metata]
MLPLYDDSLAAPWPKTAPRGLTYIYFCRHILYEDIVAATARDEKSLRDLPVELLIEILVLTASSFPAMSPTLSRTSHWVSDVTLAARMTHTLIPRGHYWRLSSLYQLLSSSRTAANAVRTVCAMGCMSWHSGSGKSEALLPRIIRECPNVRLIACQVSTFENLGSAAEPFRWAPVPRLRLMLFDGVRAEDSWSHYWLRILKTPHGGEILRHITHLHLTHHCRDFERSSPAAHLPNLTHLAMLAAEHSPYEYSLPRYALLIRDFGASLERLALQLTAVLVLWTAQKDCTRLPVTLRPPPDLIKTARESSIMICCVPRARRQLQFRDKFVVIGEDVWSMAQRQMDTMERTG